MTFEVPLVGQPLAQLARAGFLFAALDARRLPSSTGRSWLLSSSA